MEFYLLNRNLDLLMVIDTYRSAIWTERYFAIGDFELYVPASDALLDVIQLNQFIVRADDTEKCMVIENVQVTTDAEEGDYITISGRSLSVILSQRIVWKQTTYSGYVEQIIRQLITQQLISPEDDHRAVPGLILADKINFSQKIKRQYTGDNLGTAISDLCLTYKLGYGIKLDLTNKKFIFYLYQGTDRSFDQQENPYVVFSPEFDNLESSSYSNNNRNYKNVAQVAGEGEGLERRKFTVGNATGLNRYETFVDAKKTSSNDGELTPETYQSLLNEEGVQRLAELKVKISMDSKVIPNMNYHLNEDYFLGDIVEVVNEYGLSMQLRITEVIECQDESGYTCIPTFTMDGN